MSDRFLLDRHIEGYELLSLVVICEACGGRERFGHEGVQAWEAWAFQHWTDHHHDGVGAPASMKRIRKMAHEIGDKPYTESALIDEVFEQTVIGRALASPVSLSYANLMDELGLTRSQVSSRLKRLRRDGIAVTLYSPTAEVVLTALSDAEGPVSMSELSRRASIGRTATGKALRDLERGGYAVTTVDGWVASSDWDSEANPRGEMVEDLADISASEASQKIVDVLSDGPLTVSEISSAVGVSPGRVSNYLHKVLIPNGALVRVRHGFYGLPGTPPEPLTATQKALLDALSDGPKTPSEIVQITGNSRARVSENISKTLLPKGYVTRVKYGTYALAQN